MTLEHVKKPQANLGLEPVKPRQSIETDTPKRARVSATPTQLQRAKAKLEQQKTQLQRQSESLQPILETRAAVQEQARVQRLQDQIATRETQAKIQRAQEIQTKQQTFFSSFIKSPLQRKSLEIVKNSGIETSQARDQYQAAIVPEIMQRLVDDHMTVQSQVSRATQTPNALNVRTEWFNSELPILRAQHNNPASPFLDSLTVYQPTDHQALSLGRVYSLQRLSSGLTPKDAANAILNIQRKADRDMALLGLLSGINPKQSDHASIQRLVRQAEHDLELQRHALLEDAGLQNQALQLAKDEAHPTNQNSGISDKIKTKLGSGNPLPENVRQQLEAGLNTDLSRVRVHNDSDADFLSKSVHAKAFTTGNDIFFSSGAFEPNTKSGYELIAHETTHTLQQASGQVKPGIDSDPSLETAAQTKGAELASEFNPNFKYKNLENQAQPNSPLIASQPPAHRSKLQAVQRSSLLQHQPLQRDPQAANPVVAPTVSQTLDETTLGSLSTSLLPIVPKKYQADAQSNIPVILRQCFSSQIKNANQVAYILATAQHESRFGTKMYNRSESLVEDHNPLQTEHKTIKDPKTKKTHVEDIPYRSNHVNGHRVNADPNNTDNLDTYYDDAYGGKLGNVKGSSDGANYRGRGFVQITGRDNYKRLGTQLQNEGFSYTYNNQTYGSKELPIDLVANPTHVNLVPELAAKIMVSGMQNDSFAQGGKGLSTYVNDTTTDFVSARGLVNGTDRAAKIAKIAEDFAKVLNANNAWSNLFVAADLTKQAPDLTKPALTPSQTMQRSSAALQREPQPKTSEEPEEEIVVTGYRLPYIAVAWTQDGAKLRDAPNGKQLASYQLNDRFLVLESNKSWHKVKSLKDSREGWVANFTDPPILKKSPEPNAKVYLVKSGDTASNIVIKHFSNTDGALNRARRHFLIAALQSMNPNAMPRMNGGSWDNVQVNANNAIWIPSEAFANTLKGKVTVNDNFSGAALDAMASATNQTLETGSYVVKAVLEQMPGGEKVLQTINDIGTNAKLVFDDPEAFIKNLTKAVSTGFNSFGANIVTHLQTGMISVLTGQLSGSGVTLPKTFNSEGVLNVGLQLVGLNAASLEQRLAKEVPGGMQAVNSMKETADLFKQVQANGLIVTAKEHFEGLGELKDLVFSSIQSWAQSTLIKKALEVLGSALIPGAGIVQAAIKIYETITFIWDKFKMIASTLNAIVGSLADIAKGNIDGAVKKIVTSLIGGLGLAIGFLVKISGLEGIATRIKMFFQGIKTKIDTMIAKVIKWFKDKIGIRGKPSSTATKLTDKADPEHDKKVQAGLDQIDGVEAEIDKTDNDRKLTKAQAEQVAATIKRNNPIFSRILVNYDIAKTKIIYHWFASEGNHTSRRAPYTDDLEPAANEGTVSNPFLLDWGKPESANYPTIYLGGKRNHLPLSQRFVSQNDLKNKVGAKDDQNVEIKAYTPQNQETLSGGEKLGLSPNYYLSVGSLVGPLAAKGITTPGGRKITDVLKRYGFNPSAEKMDGDHIHEIQTGGSDVLENLWMLDSAINQAAGGKLDRTEIVLKSGAKPKLFQLREYVEKTNRKIYFKIKSTL